MFSFYEKYETTGNITEADCVIGHSFGTSIGPGSVNEQLGGQMLHHADGRPMIADRTLVNAMPPSDSIMACIVD